MRRVAFSESLSTISVFMPVLLCLSRVVTPAARAACRSRSLLCELEYRRLHKPLFHRIQPGSHTEEEAFHSTRMDCLFIQVQVTHESFSLQRYPQRPPAFAGAAGKGADWTPRGSVLAICVVSIRIRHTGPPSGHGGGMQRLQPSNCIRKVLM